MKNSFIKKMILGVLIFATAPAMAVKKVTAAKKSPATTENSLNGFALGGVFGMMSANIKLNSDGDNLSVNSDHDSQYLGIRGSYY